MLHGVIRDTNLIGVSFPLIARPYLPWPPFQAVTCPAIWQLPPLYHPMLQGLAPLRYPSTDGRAGKRRGQDSNPASLVNDQRFNPSPRLGG